MKLNKLLTTALLSAAGLMLNTQTSQAVVTFTAGDLVVGFTAASGTGANQVVVVSLGNAIDFRNLSSDNFNVTNVGSILDGTFGIGGGNATAWYERTDLFWGAVAVRSNTNTGDTTGGDPDITIYASKSRPSVGTAATAWSGLNGSARTTAATRIAGMQQTFDGATESSNPSAAVMATGATTWDAYNPPDTGNASFQSFIAPGLGVQQSFAAGSYGSFSGNAVEGALDIFRILNTTSGDTFGGTVGNGKYAGSVVIDNTGQFGFIAAVPEPSTYALIIVGLTCLVVFRRRLQNS